MNDLYPGDLVWIPSRTRLVSYKKNFSIDPPHPSVGIVIERMTEFAWKNWIKVLYQGELYLANKDKVNKIENESDLRKLYVSKNGTS